MKIVIINLLILTFVMANLFPGAFSEDANKYLESNGKTLFVGGNGPGNYSNIQDAIDNASDGDTVYVYSGTYPTSSIYIEKAIQIIGENRETTIVESTVNAEIYIQSHTDNVSISNFTFQNFVVDSHQNNYTSINDNIFLTTVYQKSSAVIDSWGAYNTFKGNTIILRHTTEEEIGPNECMGLHEYHSTIVNNILVGATYTGLYVGGIPTEYSQYGLNTVSGNTFSNNEVGLYLFPSVTSIGGDQITRNNFINNSIHAGFTMNIAHAFDLIKAILSHHIPYLQWNGNYWDDYTGHLSRKIPGKIQYFSTKFSIPVWHVDRHPALEPIYLNKKSVSATLVDTTSDDLEKYSYNTLSWSDWWPDFPGRYEPFFEVKDIIEFEETAWGLSTADFNKDGLLDFTVSWATSYSTISIFYNDGDVGFTQDDVFSPFYHSISDLNAGDYDNDGDIDLLFTYSETDMHHVKTNGTVNLLLNDGSNNFGDCVQITRLLPTESGERRINPQVSSADFDDDGDIDFLVGDNSGLVEFYRNNGSGAFTGVGIYDFGEEMSWGLSSADFDGDGDIDFIVTQAESLDSGWVLLVPNDGTEECFNQSDFVQVAVLHPPHPSFYTNPIAGYGCLCAIDYNNDGLMDFLFSGGDSIFLYMQNDTGFFDYFTVCRLPGVNVGNGTFYLDSLREGAIATGDFNGDDLDDLVVGGVQGVVRSFINQRMLVDIIFPDREGIIIHNEYKMDLLPFYFAFKQGTSFAFGKITVMAKELEPLQKVEFYLGNKLMYTDDAAPYEWNWTGFSFGRHIIKAVPYDLDGKQAGSDNAIIWKFF